MVDRFRVLVIDDDPGVRDYMEALVARQGYEVFAAADGEEALRNLPVSQPDLITLDVVLPGMDGLQTLDKLKQLLPDVPVVMLSGHGQARNIVEAMRRGASDFLRKPFEVEELELAFQKALEKRALKQEVERLRGRARSETDMMLMTGDNPKMREIHDIIEQVADTDITVLIRGESGTGKELVARAIYERSARREHRFLSENCSALSESLLESELFGHVRGAFTGADRDRKGILELADGGTLFLDEIGDMSAQLQTRLLRVLAENEFFRVGGQTTVRVDVRVIAATHQDLAQAVKTGRFREDLFHRLNVMRVEVPALRERREDIPELARFYLREAASELAVASKNLNTEAADLLSKYDWPGNVRELVNVCRRLTATAAGREITEQDLPQEFGGPAQEQAAIDWTADLARWADDQLAGGGSPLLDEALPAFERTLIEAALRRAQGKRLEAAKLLGWGRNTLSRKIKELGLDDS